MMELHYWLLTGGSIFQTGCGIRGVPSGCAVLWVVGYRRFVKRKPQSLPSLRDVPTVVQEGSCVQGKDLVERHPLLPRSRTCVSSFSRVLSLFSLLTETPPSFPSPLFLLLFSLIPDTRAFPLIKVSRLPPRRSRISSK